MFVVSQVVTVTACSRPQPARLPPVVQATSLGVGDSFELRIVGEDKLPTEYTVAEDGTVDLPYVDRVEVAGLEPQEIAEKVKLLLIEKEILLRPSVSVVVKAFSSKRVDVQGEVKKPDAYPVEPGMTLLGVISRAGGLTSLAQDDIVIRRRDKTGRVVTSSVSYSAIRNNEIPDVPLQAGDTIFVNQRVF